MTPYSLKIFLPYSMLSIVLLLTMQFQVHSQCLNAFSDQYDKFKIIEDAKVFQESELKVHSFKVGKKAVAYVDAFNNFKLFSKGRSQTIQEIAPIFYDATDHLIVYQNTGNQLYCIEDDKKHFIGQYKGDYAYGDSLIAYNDYYGEFKVFYKGETHIVENRPVKIFKVKDNCLVYIDINSEMKLFKGGKVVSLEFGNLPISFETNLNIVAYVDGLNNFTCYYKGGFYDLQSFAPKSYTIGENMVAYIDNKNRLKAFYNGRIYEILDYEPKSYEAIEDLLLFYDLRDYLYVFYKGETYQLSNYKPKEVQVDNGIIVYKDLDNKLHQFLNSNKTEIAGDNIRFYQLRNKSILFYQVPSRISETCNGGVINKF